MEEMSKAEQIAFLENAIATLTEMRQTVAELMAENEARLVIINANIEMLSTASIENTKLLKFVPTTVTE